MPKVLLFDLDETLIENEQHQENSLLSPSARIIKSSSPPSIFKNIIALNRKKMKAIVFDRVFNLLEKTKELNIILAKYQKEVQPTIKLGIVTSGGYEKEKIMQSFKHFFAKSELPIEFYNKHNLPKIAIGFIPANQKYEITNREDKYDDENQWRKLRNFELRGTKGKKNKGKQVCKPKKACLMAKEFPRWQNEMPGLQKADVVLVDNDEAFLIAAKEAGFPNVVHNNTTRHSRVTVKETYEQSAKKIFEQLYNIVSAAEEEFNIKAREAIALVQKESGVLIQFEEITKYSLNEIDDPKSEVKKPDKQLYTELLNIVRAKSPQEHEQNSIEENSRLTLKSGKSE